MNEAASFFVPIYFFLFLTVFNKKTLSLFVIETQHIMGRFINPFTDFGFKFLFGREVEKELLIDFLNDLLVGEHVITDIQFLNNEQQPEVKTERGLIYDIYCRTNTGEHIIVEMQNREQPYFKDRALFYLSRAITQQARKGIWNFQLDAVYGVFFMNFVMDKDIPSKSERMLSFLTGIQVSFSIVSSGRFLLNCRTLIKKRMNVKMILNAGFIY